MGLKRLLSVDHHDNLERKIAVTLFNNESSIINYVNMEKRMGDALELFIKRTVVFRTGSRKDERRKTSEERILTLALHRESRITLGRMWKMASYSMLMMHV